MKELQELRNDILLLKNIGTISKEVELVMLRKLNTIEKQLTIPVVSQQRELLLAFHKSLQIYTDDLNNGLAELDVDNFLANNCA